MKQYFIFCTHSKQTKFVGTLQQCYNELKNCAGFGIANSEGIPLAYRTPSGFKLPQSLANKYPKINNALTQLYTWY